MPVVIDGYNLFHFARGIYLEDGVDLPIPTFCGLVEEWAGQARQKVLMVFDGSPPPAMRQNQTHYGVIALKYTAAGSDADTFIMDCILKNTAPKLLTVVSSDLRITVSSKVAAVASNTCGLAVSFMADLVVATPRRWRLADRLTS